MCGQLTSPANAAKMRLELRLQQASGWLDFDDVSLQEVLTYNLVYDGENRLVKVLNGSTPIASYSYVNSGIKRVLPYIM